MEPFVVLKHISTISGTKTELPKPNWKTEIKVFKLLSDALKSLPEVTANLGSENPNFLVILPILLEKVPDTITEMVAEITKKDATWVEENLDSETIVDLLYPFFGRFISKISSTVSRMKEGTQKSEPVTK